jgi:hypothetical protein
MIETDPYKAWHIYASKSGLLDENGEAPDRMKAQTAFYAFAYAWNLLVKEHLLRRGELS